MEPFCGTQGLRRLGAMIEVLSWELVERGTLEKLRNVLLDAYANTKTIEQRHAAFVKAHGYRRCPTDSREPTCF